jgi:branched-chain amino acid transport system substrate-binding protein
LNDDRAARVLLEELLDRYPDSVYRPDAWWTLASIQEDRGDWYDAAVAYAHFLDFDVDAARRQRARARLTELIDTQLSLDELQKLDDAAGDTVAGSYIAYSVASRRFEAYDPPDQVGPLLEDFLERFPQSQYVEAVEQMLAELRSRGDYEPSRVVGVGYVDRIGLLCPLTGEYAALGQAMYEGAMLALEEHNRSTNDALKLISLDTRGDGVSTVLATRTLIEDDGVLGIVGALLSPTTIAAAAVCQERGVPLISPTATQENISELGAEVFQTNSTHAFETRMVARVTVERLLRRRLAILYPDTDEGRTAANLFAREAEGLGARIVAAEPYERGLTDFKEPIERIRAAGPEALFVPAGPSEMRLIAPQLTFYQLEVQLLGPSTWNNQRLASEVSDELDRAVFPSDTAQMPVAVSQRFEELWRRAHRDDPGNPFALKTYYAILQVLSAVHDGARNRRALGDELTRRLVLSGLEEGAAGTDTGLRYMDQGKVLPFPYAIFESPYPDADPEVEQPLEDTDLGPAPQPD